MKQRSALGAKTLPGAYYTSEEVWRIDLEKVFRRRWLYVGHERRLPAAGSFFLHGVANDSVVVLRDREGRLRAFHNLCRHRGARLCTEPEGTLGGLLRCPYHSWTYDHDGRLVTAPNMQDVAGFERGDYPLHRVAVGSWEGLLFVNLAPDPEPLESAFRPLWGRFGRWRIPELTVVHRTEYEVRANWKLFFQNYSECYHCPGVHPHLNRLTPYRATSNDLEEGPFLGGPMNLSRGVGGSMTMSGDACAAPLADLSEEDRARVYYYTIFPNMFLSLHPDYVLVHRAEALAVDRTRIVCEWLFHPEAVQREGFDASGAVEFWDLTNRQDWELCALTQQGVASSAYVPGPYAELESQLAAFDLHYLRTIGHQPPTVRAASV